MRIVFGSLGLRQQTYLIYGKAGTSFQFFQGGGGNAFFETIQSVCARVSLCVYCTRTWAHVEQFTHTLLLYAYIIVIRVHNFCMRT